VTPIVKIDGHAVGNGRPGPFASGLRKAIAVAFERSGIHSTPAADPKL